MSIQNRNPLLPLVKLCRNRRGLKSEVLRRLVRRGMPGNWSTVSGWLHPDEKRRRIPRPESMAGLVEIYKELIDENENRN